VLYVLVFALGLGAGFLFLSPRAGAHTTIDGTITGSVGLSTSANAYSIGLSTSTVAPGTYEFDITDYATIHNFDLLGPDNVSIDKTSISGTGSVSWIVTLSPGVYKFHCDVHFSTMNGTLTVTGGTTSTATTGTTTTSTTTPTTTAQTTTTTTTPTTTTTAGSPLKVWIASVHATRKLVVVTVQAKPAHARDRRPLTQGQAARPHRTGREDAEAQVEAAAHAGARQLRRAGHGDLLRHVEDGEKDDPYPLARDGSEIALCRVRGRWPRRLLA
jgi:hypothetical protein